MCFKKTIVYVCLLTGLAMVLAMAGPSAGQNASTAAEAPSGYDNQPNGLTDSATFTMDRGKFEETEAIGDGLGPICKAQSAANATKTPSPAQPARSRNPAPGTKTRSGTLLAPRQRLLTAR
jgi:hypothetical protein